jgi:hypothetical protein
MIEHVSCSVCGGGTPEVNGYERIGGEVMCSMTCCACYDVDCVDGRFVSTGYVARGRGDTQSEALRNAIKDWNDENASD